jgi:hypothetical protein
MSRDAGVADPAGFGGDLDAVAAWRGFFVLVPFNATGLRQLSSPEWSFE